MSKNLQVPKKSFFSSESRFKRSYKEITDVVKIYPDRVVILKYKHKRTQYYKDSDIPHDPAYFGDVEDIFDETSSSDSIDKSISRSRTIIRDYILCNDFTIFGTLTFDPQRWNDADLRDLDQCNKIMNQFIKVEQQNHFRKFNSKFGYILIPERHKTGVYHYHILLSGYNESLLMDFFDQRNQFLANYERFADKHGRYDPLKGQYFAMLRNTVGRNQFEKINDKDRVASYILKYITKDIFYGQKHKKRFSASKGLKKPIILHNVFEENQYHIANAVRIYDNDFYSIHEARYYDYEVMIENLKLAFYNIS